MLDKIIHFSIKNKFVIGLFTLSLILWGIYSVTRLPIDALPDITNNQVQIITLSPTLATQEVEQLITFPIEQAVKPIPKVVELRSVSKFGLSVVTVVFEESADVYWARSQISERLKEAEENIGPGLGTPEMAPISTGLGEIYQYVVFPKEGFEDKFSATELRTIQDWIIKPQLIGTPGVAEVNTLGGLLKEYEISVQPDKLKSMNTNILEIYNALQRNNENTGGAYIDKKPNAYFIRGLGMINSMDDIRKIVIKNVNGIPILIRDVAEVKVGSAIRYGATTKDGKGEAVSGMVMMLKGSNSADVVRTVKEKIELIKKTLPEGVDVEPFLDRTKLVNNAISTVETNLIEGALIVIFVLVLLIGNFRAGLIVASVIPMSLLFAVSLMNLFGVSGNLMSLGAIDFGLIVDGAVIIVEAIVHRLQHTNEGKLTASKMDGIVQKEASKLMNSAAFGQIIILIVYLPILSLVGIEGKMFKPMAQTVSFAILGAFILSLTYVPMMAALFLSKTTGPTNNIADRIIRFFYKVYEPLLTGALKMKAIVLGIALLLFVSALLVFRTLGGEFIPTLEEGDIATHVISPPGSSLMQEIEATTKAEQILLAKFPEVIEAVSKIGSAEIPTDPMPMEVADMMVILKDKDEWTSAETTQELKEKMEEALNDIPGVTYEFTQPVQMRFNELMTGVRSDVAVKIFGEDLDLLAGLADEVVPILQSVEGVEDARAEQVSGLPQITVRYNKDKLALYGLNVGDLNQVVRASFAGEKAGVVYEGEKRFDLVVRVAKDDRQDIGNLKALYIPLPSGNQVPLEQVADIAYERGVAQVSREDGKRRIVIGFNVRGRDVKTVVNEISEKLDAQLKLPIGYFTTYGGQFQNLVEANKRLSIAVPAALALIFILLFFAFGSIKQALLIFTAIPLSAIGGVFALWIRDMPFSISAGVGFIALFGVAVLNGIVLIGYFNQLKKEGMTNVMERIMVGTKVRLRPVIMTASVASLGFLPMAISMGAGAEVQKPLATVVIGGLISATLLTLIVLPILYLFIETGLKKIKLVNSLPVFLILFIPAQNTLNAQVATPVTLTQVLDLAYKNNQLLNVRALDIQAWQLRKGAYSILPKTSFNATIGQVNTIKYDNHFSVTQEFPNPGLMKAKKNLAEEFIQSSAQRLNISKQELTYNIRQSFYQIRYLQAAREVFEREDSLLRQFVKVADVKYRTGETNLLEKTTAETKEQQLQQSIQQTINQIEIEKVKLQYWINSNIDITIDDEDFSPIPLTQLVDATYIQNSPSLIYARQQVSLLEAERNVIRAEAGPDFSIGYFIQSFSGTQEVDGIPRTYNATPRFHGATVGVSMPILGRKGFRSNVAAADMQIEVQHRESDLLQSQLQSQLQQYQQQYIFWSDNVTYYQNVALPNARSMITNATRGYQGGDIGYVEYAQALQTNLEIQKMYLDAINNLNQTIISIQFITNQ
ncbi:MAG TPA: CusA/CzcA family heavy metal efflux RND transporter [Saprospiraceae bacterium]|nr:CusA/CzcA family heavy metal efflux RND transporter [Saprospiraceae bacterium]